MHRAHAHRLIINVLVTMALFVTKPTARTLHYGEEKIPRKLSKNGKALRWRPGTVAVSNMHWLVRSRVPAGNDAFVRLSYVQGTLVSQYPFYLQGFSFARFESIKSRRIT